MSSKRDRADVADALNAIESAIAQIESPSLEVDLSGVVDRLERIDRSLDTIASVAEAMDKANKKRCEETTAPRLDTIGLSAAIYTWLLNCEPTPARQSYEEYRFHVVLDTRYTATSNFNPDDFDGPDKDFYLFAPPGQFELLSRAHPKVLENLYANTSKTKKEMVVSIFSIVKTCPTPDEVLLKVVASVKPKEK